MDGSAVSGAVLIFSSSEFTSQPTPSLPQPCLLTSCFATQPSPGLLTSCSCFHSAPPLSLPPLTPAPQPQHPPFLLLPPQSTQQPHTRPRACGCPACLQEAASLTYCIFIRKSCTPRKRLNDEVFMQYLLTGAMRQPPWYCSGIGIFL